MNAWFSICVVMLLTVPALAQIGYPPTLQQEQFDEYHGVTVADPYRWLENDTAMATRKWVAAQQVVTNAYLAAIPFRDDLRKRMAEVYNYPRYSVPFRNTDYYYYFRNDGLQPQAVLYRQQGEDGPPVPVIDPNDLSVEGTSRLTDFELSRDGRYAVWGLSKAGSDWNTFLVKDMHSLEDLADTISWVKFSNIAWQGNGFFYSRYPRPEAGGERSSLNEYHQVWFHRIGTSQREDRRVYVDSLHPQRFHFVSSSEDQRFVFLSISDGSGGHVGNALYYLDGQDPEQQFRPIIPGIGAFDYAVIGVDHNQDFLVHTNEDAPNGKIVRFTPNRGAGRQWTTVVPERAEPLESANTAGGQLFLRYLKDVSSRVYAYTFAGKRIREVRLPGPGNVDGFQGLKDDRHVFYTFTSLHLPQNIYRYEIATGRSSLFRKAEVDFASERYITRQVFFTSKDGTRVPMFIVHRKGMPLNGKNPTLLFGYGGFNITMFPCFNASRIPWLEQGGVFALANLRGGNEYGEEWHQAGMLNRKQNVFDDFIAAAEYLVDKKYTSPEKLGIWGRSNGGLLVGAVANQRPDLFAVAIPEVGVMDMLRFQRFTIGFNWISEYGSSEDADQFNNLYAYSPLHNLQPGPDHPATLVVTADHDDRVVPAHSFKYIATLQAKYTGSRPQLVRIDTDSGHGASSIIKNIDLATDIYSFILYNMGVLSLRQKDL